MTLTITGGSRPKLDTSTSLSTSISADNPVESSNYFSIRVKNPSFTPAEFTVTADITTSSDTITTTGGGFINIRVGDVLNSTSLDTDSVVVSKSVDNNTIVVDLDATGTATGESITVTPGNIAATYYYIKLEHEFTGSKLKITPTIYLFDGTKVAEGGTLDDSDNATINDYATLLSYTSATIDIDTFILMLDYPVLTLNSFSLNRELAQQKRRRREEYMYNMTTGGAIGGGIGSITGLAKGNSIPWTIGGIVVGAGLGSYYTRKAYRNRKTEKNWIQKYKNNKIYGK